MIKNSKKAQNSIEFILILVFMLAIISLIMFVVGKMSLEYKLDEEQLKLDDFANSLIYEAIIIQNVEDGYNRTVEIPAIWVERYNLTFNGTYFLLRNDELYGENSDTFFYYEIPGGHNFTYYSKTDADGITKYYLIMVRNSTAIPTDLVLYNISN